MPPKAKPSVKKKKKKALVDVPPPARSLYGPGSGNENPEKLLLEKLVTRSDLLFVRLKMADLAYADFTVMVHASAPLYTLCRKIEEKHGRMGLDAAGHTTLQLFRHPPNEKNLLPPSDWHLRLEQLGMAGGTVEEQHQAIIYYNFTPAHSDALLQREPQLMLHALTVEESEAYAEAAANGSHGGGGGGHHEAAAYLDAVHTHAASVAILPANGSASSASLGGVGASVSAAAAAASSGPLASPSRIAPP